MSHMPGAIWVDPDDSDVTGVVNKLSNTKPGLFVCECVCMCVCMCVCLCICECMYVCTYACMCMCIYVMYTKQNTLGVKMCKANRYT